MIHYGGFHDMAVNFSKIKEQFPKTSIVLLICFIFFISSNTAGIYGGACQSSPCTQLNDSFHGDSVDHIIMSDTFLTLAPTGYFLPDLFKKQGFLIEQQVVRSFAADLDDAIARRSESLKNDVPRLSKGYFLVKAVILLSIPYWLFLLWVGKKLWKHWLGKAFVGAFVGFYTLMGFLIRASDFFIGEGESLKTAYILSQFFGLQ